MQRDGRLVQLRLGACQHSAAACEMLGAVEQDANGTLADLIERMAYIEAGGHNAGDDVTCSGFHGDLANGGNQIGGGLSEVLSQADPLGCAGKCVVARHHGGGAGVTRLPDEAVLPTAYSDNAVDHS